MKAGAMGTETPTRRGRSSAGCLPVTGGAVDVGPWGLSEVVFRRREEVG